VFDQLSSPVFEFSATRLGVLMQAQAYASREALGVLNPGAARSRDGRLHLFPRYVDARNISRIGHARVLTVDDVPHDVERLGVALEPADADDALGCEDARVTYVPLLRRYVMTYSAAGRNGTRIGVAVSGDLERWQRIGIMRYAIESSELDLNSANNKDAALFSDVVLDPDGVPSFGIMHRPTTRAQPNEHIWLSYIPVEAVLDDLSGLTMLQHHRPILGPEQSWEADKVGVGAPPIRINDGWLVPYHGVSSPDGYPRYSMGFAVLDGERPDRVLYRTPRPVLEPLMTYEHHDGEKAVVFPTAVDLRPNGELDIYYGAADRVIAVARVTLPPTFTRHEAAHESPASPELRCDITP
jgi:predicted GH43/DUF377 family glycosyl hydrolase